jgi:hypothetical protein
VEGVFNYRYIQNNIHDTPITIRHNGQEHVFHVFCQNHCHLPPNTAVAGSWRGEIVVMKAGLDNVGVVNMRLQDAKQVDEAINQYVI